MANLLVLLAI